VNAAEASRVLADITYKPGVRVLFAGNRLKLVAPVICVETGEGTELIATGASLDEIDSPDSLLYHVELMVARYEEHERKEWLRYKGRQITPPHPAAGGTSGGRSPDQPTPQRP